MSIAYGLSFAALIFAPPLHTWLAYGIAATSTRTRSSPRKASTASSMHFILKGRVGIIVRMDDGRLIRVRSLGPHTTIGEMGLITSQLRSATIQAEVPSVVYALSADAYERIKRDNSALAQALLTYVISVMGFASKVIGVLRR